jgi:hypothetical protein
MRPRSRGAIHVSAEEHRVAAGPWERGHLARMGAGRKPALRMDPLPTLITDRILYYCASVLSGRKIWPCRLLPTLSRRPRSPRCAVPASSALSVPLFVAFLPRRHDAPLLAAFSPGTEPTAEAGALLPSPPRKRGGCDDHPLRSLCLPRASGVPRSRSAPPGAAARLPRRLRGTEGDSLPGVL